jgi:hypothetical protein
MDLHFQIRPAYLRVKSRAGPFISTADAIKRALGIYQGFIENNYALRVTLLLAFSPHSAEEKFLPPELGRVQPPVGLGCKVLNHRLLCCTARGSPFVRYHITL